MTIPPDYFVLFEVILFQLVKFQTIDIILGSLVIPEHPIMERVQNAVGRFNDNRSEFMKIAYRDKETEGLGCGHPSVIKHRKNAEVLTYRLKTIIAEL